MIVLGSPHTHAFPELLSRKDSLTALVIGGSAGSFSVTNRLLEQLPPSFPLPVIIALHRLKDKREGFKEALQIRSKLPVNEPDDKTHIQPGTVYIAPANYHLLIETPEVFALSTTELVQYSRPSIDVFFDSAADVFGKGLVAILLSGANRDGASGLYRIQEKGGLTIVQDPADCSMPTMPAAAIKLMAPDYILPEHKIVQLLQTLS